jgi:hypothetical protein
MAIIPVKPDETPAGTLPELIWREFCEEPEQINAGNFASAQEFVSVRFHAEYFVKPV